MGLKIGLMEVAAKAGFYLAIDTRKSLSYSYAQPVFAIENGKHISALRFLNGTLGRLVLNSNYQLEVFELDMTTDWVPTKEQSAIMSGETLMQPEKVLFRGGHRISEVFPVKGCQVRLRRKFFSVRPNELDFVVMVDNQVRETSHDLVSPPFEIHTTVKERFENPQGLWNRAVARCLEHGGALLNLYVGIFKSTDFY